MRDATLVWLRLRHFGRRLGWPAVLGAALVTAAVAVDAFGVSALEEGIEQVRKKRGELRQQIARAAGGDGAPMLQLDQLQDRQRVEVLLAELHASAAANGVSLAQGEYRLQAEPGTRLARYRMILPAQGSYVQLRAWLDALAASQPGLQVDEMALKRENISQDGIEARISLSLLVRLS